MWEIDNFGNAINPETENEIYQIVGGDGWIYVFYNENCIAQFRLLEDAQKFIERKVEKLNSADE